MIKAIFIDVDNTLLDFHKCAEYALKNAFAEIGVEASEEMIGLFHRINNSLWERYEKGEITKDGIFGIRFVKILEILKIEYDGYEFEKKFRKYIDVSAEMIDGALEICEYLSQKYELYAASNAAALQQEIRLKKSGILPYLKGIFTSEQIGFSKPEKAFFDECLRLSDKKCDEVMIIGDSLSADIQGGINSGIKTVWFDPNNTNNSKGFVPDHRIESLFQIKNIL